MEQHRPIDEPHVSSHAVIGQLAGYPLLEALIERRSRRFGHGMRLNGVRSPTRVCALRSR